MSLFLLGLLALVIIDIRLFLVATESLASGWVWGILLGTAAIGLWAIGKGPRARLLRSGSHLEDPTGLVAAWLFDVVAGIALIVPGGLTDLLGLLLLLPPVRRFVRPRIGAYLRRKSLLGSVLSSETEPTDARVHPESKEPGGSGFRGRHARTEPAFRGRVRRFRSLEDRERVVIKEDLISRSTLIRDVEFEVLAADGAEAEGGTPLK